MHLEVLKQTIKPYRESVISHSLYQNLKSVNDVKSLMELHVYAVWDFMSLLKALQKEFTCVDIPWVPSMNPDLRRFINEIVLEEESDVDLDGNYKSHLEMYLEAMVDLGANVEPFNLFLSHFSASGLEFAINQLESEEAKSFLRYTFEVINSNKPHCIAAAFTFGREDLIPDMFHVLVNGLHELNPEELKKLKYYLDRHIELDGDNHGPLAEKMMLILCGDDDIKWKEATETAIECLNHRRNLWTGVEQKINILANSN